MILTQLRNNFEPKKNREYEIYKFRPASQRHDEKLDSYHTRLRHLASTCEFADMDREIKTQIVRTCTPQQLRRKALPTEMTLQQLLDQGRANELSHQQAQEMENNNTESVNQRKLPRPEITSRRISIHNAKDKDKNKRNYVIIAANPILILAYVQQKGKRVDFVGS
jgi:hypothetical protein